jgi:hypothetical protein
MLTSTISGSVGAAATAIRVAVGAAALAAGMCYNCSYIIVQCVHDSSVW